MDPEAYWSYIPSGTLWEVSLACHCLTSVRRREVCESAQSGTYFK